MHTFRIAKPEHQSDWSAYHAIRRAVLWEARGDYSYDADHVDEFLPGHFPMILVVDDIPLGVVRIDVRPESGEAAFRRVAVSIPHQRRGYGRLLMAHAEGFARDAGCYRFVANVALDAVPFYSKLGYRFDSDSPFNDEKHRRMTKDTGKG